MKQKLCVLENKWEMKLLNNDTDCKITQISYPK